jgi:hypothetical protein
MSKDIINSANLLPEYFQTDKNSKFLSSSIDQLIQPAQIERISGFIGSKLSPTYNSTADNYIPDVLEIRKDYQFNPALIVYDELNNIQRAIGIDDLTNSISIQSGLPADFDKLYSSPTYSYNPHINWDKFTSYQKYYWLPTGPATIVIGSINNFINVDVDIIGRANYSFTYVTTTGTTATQALSNGMKIQFASNIVSQKHQGKIYFVEGVGSSIVLVDYDRLSINGLIKNNFFSKFDAHAFDQYGYDSISAIPINSEYITINRASSDLNPWTRYNRWFHQDIITISATVNGIIPVYPASKRAQRPIVEFNAGLKLYNFGTVGISKVDIIDTDTIDAFSSIEGSEGYYIDGILLEKGNRIIFNADKNQQVRGNIYVVNFAKVNDVYRIQLLLDTTPSVESAVVISNGIANKGTSWHFNGHHWVFSQQHTTLNQFPLFDLFDNIGNSYSDPTYYQSDFIGNRVFNYAIGTGAADTILGFPLQYKNSVGVGSYLFNNYFMTETITISNNNVLISVPTSNTYLKYANRSENKFVNVWEESFHSQIPILQFQSTTTATSSLQITAIDHPVSTQFNFDVYVNGIKLKNTQYSVSTTAVNYFVNFNSEIPAYSNVLFKIYNSKAIPASAGFYQVPLSLTNNPLNGPISSMTETEITDHVKTMINTIPNFSGIFPGENNLRDLNNYPGTQLISNANPLPFAFLFIGDKRHNLITAVQDAAAQYNQFKLEFLKQIELQPDQTDYISAVDTAMAAINQNKTNVASYSLSDMIGYGQDKIVRTWTVTDSRNTIYPLTSSFDLTTLSLRAVAVYINDVQLIVDVDYKFLPIDSAVEFLVPLKVKDVIVINDYQDTSRCYIPSTPTKLGLYPAFVPSIYVDTTYVTPQTVIQGHDGSITIAYNDYRDQIILELEKRIYNNIKTKYRPELFDINSVLPGNFRNTDYSLSDITQILEIDFIKWAGIFGIDYFTNSTFDNTDPFTWNYTGAVDNAVDTQLSGYWRNIYKLFYDTDRPHTHPWEMLGLSQKPNNWDATYGVAPYTSGNKILWDHIETGGGNLLYARAGLSNILPVDEYGDLVPPSRLVYNTTAYSVRQSFKFGDQGPVETAWRKSSFYPFAIQRLLALTKPAIYASLMYDTSRMNLNIAGQWTYGNTQQFLNPKNIVIHGDNRNLTSGYGVYVSEYGQKRSSNYIAELKTDLTYFNINLFYKVGGFISKNNMIVTIDAYNPTSVDPGAILPQEDYSLFLNVSSPIETANISGIVIQKSNGAFIVKGYDQYSGFFNVYQPIRNNSTSALTVGGISESYVKWSSAASAGPTGLSAVETTSAKSAINTLFYTQGQLVFYNNKYYRVKISHTPESSFNESLYVQLPALPVTGGVTVQRALGFSSQLTKIPYGTTFSTVQEVYDFIIGYGHFLESRGFIFDEYNADIGEPLDWNFTGKEFLFWTSQNWVDNSIITLSPFATQIKFQSTVAVVDNLFDSSYEYSILRSDGRSFSQKNLSVNRQNGVCTITANNTDQGIYFAVLRPVQKEHGMVLNNISLFNDTIFDIQSGYRQLRIKLSGLRTAGWNGDFSSPGFVYDTAKIHTWTPYVNYLYADTISFNGKNYSAKKDIPGSASFNVRDGWILLNNSPTAELIPNFDYKINQFSDFYNLNIDNFDAGQEKLAQHLIGYTPRPYLNGIFSDPIAQYKFYQGYIKEKGTKNPISKLSKASLFHQQGTVDYSEEWGFRVGIYGSYSSYQEIEFPLTEGTFLENPQLVNFNLTKTITQDDLTVTILPSDLQIIPINFDVNSIFATNTETDNLINTAGYVRIDDVTATAYNENSLLDIATTSLPEGTTVWLGFKTNGDWDVLRYENAGAKLVGVYISSPGYTITFTTDVRHSLKVGDIIFCTQFNTQVNGVYRIIDISSPTEFTVPSQLAIINNDPVLSPGLLFKFNSQRFATFSQIPDDYKLLKLPYNSKLWIDEDSNGRWAVYQKTQNYITNSTTNPNSTILEFGRTLAKRKNGNVLMVSAPYGDGTIDRSPELDGNLGGSGFDIIASTVTNTTTATGKIFVYNTINSSTTLSFSYDINQDGYTSVHYHYSLDPIEPGMSMAYDDINFNNTRFGLMLVGAPGAGATVSNSPSGGVRQSTGTGTVSTLVQEGLVKISSKSSGSLSQKTEFVLLSPDTSNNYQRFGSSIFVQYDTGTKLVLVGAPATGTTGTGAVYSYKVDSTGPSVLLEYNGYVSPGGSVSTGSLWGYAISGSDDGNYIAISAPGANVSTGFVSIYQYSNNELTLSQTIRGSDLGFSTKSEFGAAVTMSPDGSYLFISAPSYQNHDRSSGIVAVFTNTNGTFIFNQTITNPRYGQGMKFGKAIDCNTSIDNLVISAIGGNVPQYTEFDSTLASGLTTFDTNETSIVDLVGNSGEVYVYNRAEQHGRFALADELRPSAIVSNSAYGISLRVDDASVYVGSPFPVTSLTPTEHGTFFQFTKTNPAINSLQKLRTQPSSVDINQFQKVSLIDTRSEEIIDYLDIIDPVKGKIAGLAREELRYISSYDPAIYSIGTSGVNVNTNTSWLDDHVGELWWDLSTVKYMWYEQGELTYRKNNWGKLFPGATIDVYEWVGTKYLPSEWSIIADTTIGLVESISGQPKYPSGNIMAVKQVYNSSGSFTNFYYYWVKNKITIPATKNRRKSAFEVASLIADPVSYGYKFLSPIAPSTISLANISTELVANNINLNIAYDKTNNNINKHTEWLLLQEGNANSQPTTILEKKLIDSLRGHDSLGNPVPDPALSKRLAYGIGIRPRQSMFVKKKEALRNLVNFTNSILLSNQLTGNYNFANLISQEPPPNQYSNSYDQIVEDVEFLNLINTIKLQQAQLSCTVENGKLNSVKIVDPGFGYKIAPSIKFIGTDKGTDAVIETTINSQGSIVSVQIVNAGEEYITAPMLEVRAYSVLVLSDTDSNGKWAMFSWDKISNQWIKSYTQLYNTNLYWKYVDWSASTFNEYIPYSATIPSLSYLSTVTDIQPNQYLKVFNGGDGNYLILERTTSGIGTFSNDYNLVFKQNGTIQLLDTLWSVTSGNLTYSAVNYDQTLFDQTADIELVNILNALKYDIFIGDLKVYWNLFFFSAVKYALTEQKLLDWAFKTSFINVTNYAGNLDQRPVYQLQDDTYFIDYISEVKPYHTQIRKYTTNYTYVDPSQSFTTDFDLPAVYNTATGLYQSVELGDPILSTYPWKAWTDNHSFYVGSIVIGNPGKNYTSRPTVIIQSAPGDQGSGATAEAYISGGQIIKIIVLSPGANYLTAPSVIIQSSDPNAQPAVAYAQLANNTIRNNLIGMKFDRVGVDNSFEVMTAVDIFNCDGNTNEFTLRWLASPIKLDMSITLNGSYVILSDFIIEFYTETVDGYPKEFSKIVLNYIPAVGQVLSVTYNKNIKLLNASERILNFYTATSGMPGLDLGQLMTGIDFPKTSIQSLPFNYTLIWDQDLSIFGKDLFSDNSNYYNSSIVTESVPSPGTGTAIIIPTSAIDLNTNIILIPDHKFLNGMSVRYSVNGVTAIDGLFNNKIYYVRVVDDNQFYLYDSRINAVNLDDTNGQIIFRGRGNNDQTLTNVVNYNQLTVNSTENIQLGQLVNIIGKTTPSVKLNPSTTVTVVDINHDTSQVILSEPFISEVDVGDVAEFWTFDSNSSLYDSNITGGSWDNGIISNPLGINPEDINIDGSGFYTPDYGHAPEEVVPGHASDSFALNVFTVGDRSAPTVLSNYAPLNANTATIITLPIQPTDPASITVYYRNNLFTYNTSTSFTQFVDSTEFTIDWINNTLIVAPQSRGGNIGYRIVSIGGEAFGTYRGVLDSASQSVINGESAGQAQSLSDIDTVKDAIVYVNGESVPKQPLGFHITAPVSYTYFELGPVSSTNNRAAAKVYNLPPGKNNIHAWFFGNPYKLFNEINQQAFSVDSDPRSIFDLEYPPRVILPEAAQAIVEINTGTGFKIMLPPPVTYYNITDPRVSTYLIDPQKKFPQNKNYTPVTGNITTEVPIGSNAIKVQSVDNFHIGQVVVGTDNNLFGTSTDVTINDIDYVKNEVYFSIGTAVSLKSGDTVDFYMYDYNYSYNPDTVRVYINGRQIINGTDYKVNFNQNSVTINNQLLSMNDVIAILWLPQGFYDYDLIGSQLILVNPVTDVNLNVITYTNHDNMMIETTTYPGNGIGRFKTARPVLNSNYIWVILNGVPLINTLDHTLLNDRLTVQLSNRYTLTSNDRVEIISVSDQGLSAEVVGFRMFNDIFNRTEFDRLSVKNSTKLSQPLLVTDKEIHVDNALALTRPIISKKIPGVVIIEGERIEFFRINGNTLSQLRRGTLGTSPSNTLEIGTTVIDQSYEQTMPFKEHTLKQSFITTATDTYQIYSTSTNLNDGIVLNPEVPAIDQLLIFYGGRPLRKSGIFVQDTQLSYDDNLISEQTIMTTATINLLPLLANVGDAYHIFDTGQVWIYENSLSTDAVNGYVYRGLNYIPPEFSIDASTQLLTLSIPGGVTPNIKVTIIKKETTSAEDWNYLNTATNLLATFLQSKPAQLPDIWYYGGNHG